jgi:hypothetical protein
MGGPLDGGDDSTGRRRPGFGYSLFLRCFFVMTFEQAFQEPF